MSFAVGGGAGRNIIEQSAHWIYHCCYDSMGSTFITVTVETNNTHVHIHRAACTCVAHGCVRDWFLHMEAAHHMCLQTARRQSMIDGRVCMA